MIKKLLFIAFLYISTVSFSQKTIKNLSAAPNPFIYSTTIFFQSKKEQPVIIIVKNILGKIVLKKQISAKKGRNLLLFYRNNLKAGMYIYNLSSNEEIISKRFIIQ